VPVTLIAFMTATRVQTRNWNYWQFMPIYDMVSCREHVVTGDTAWLDGVSRHKPRHLVAAGWMMGILHMNQLTDVLYLITWLPD